VEWKGEGREREGWGDHLPYSPTGFCLKYHLVKVSGQGGGSTAYLLRFEPPAIV